MKKVKYLLLVCAACLLMTGCVKYNANMEIKKDKSMDFSIIYAVDTSIFGDELLLEDADKKKLQDQGFTVTDYSQDKMKGYTISKEVKNIDAVSSTDDTEYSLSSILDNKTDNSYIFKVKKGLFKNTYTAKFDFNASDSDLNATDDDTTTSTETEETDDWDYGTDDVYDSTDDVTDDTDSDFDTSDMDFSSMMSNMDLSFNVTLPYSAINSNATTTNNDSKNLSWSLSSEADEAIEFEFELYNMTNIYICIGLVILILVIAIVAIINKNKNNKVNVSSLNNASNVVNGDGAQA